MAVTAKRLIHNRFFLLGLVGITVIGVLAIVFQPVENDLVRLGSNFSFNFNPFDYATPDQIAQLSIIKSQIADCQLENRIWYVDNGGTKRLIHAKFLITQPFIENSLTAAQTNREIQKFIFEIIATCVSKPGFESLDPKVSGGSTTLEIFATKQDGSQIKVYSKNTAISQKDARLVPSVIILSTEIPASEIERVIPKAENAYVTNIKFKPTVNMQIYLTNAGSTKWFVQGSSEANLKTVVSGQGCSFFSCIPTNTEIRLSYTPSDGKVPTDKRRVDFTVLLPDWIPSQGTPSFYVTASNGATIIPKTSLPLIQQSNGGFAAKAILLPNAVGTYDLTVTQSGRNAATATFNVFVKPTSITCEEEQIVVDGKCTNPPPIECPEGQKLVGNECIPIGGGGGDDNPPPQENEIFKLLQELLTKLLLSDFAGLQDPKFYGFYVVFGILFIIIIVASAATRK